MSETGWSTIKAKYLSDQMHSQGHRLYTAAATDRALHGSCSAVLAGVVIIPAAFLGTLLAFRLAGGKRPETGASPAILVVPP